MSFVTVELNRFEGILRIRYEARAINSATTILKSLDHNTCHSAKEGNGRRRMKGIGKLVG